MANLRVPYQSGGNVIGTMLSQAVANAIKAHDAMVRINAILVAIGLATDVETALNMEAGHSYGDALVAIVGNAVTNLETVAADMGRLDQG